MEIIINMDLKDYDESWDIIYRYASKAIIVKNHKIAFQRSNKGDYKLIGGGIDKGETPIEALIREVKEETGYDVIYDSIKEIGIVKERRKEANSNSIWDCTNYIYECEIDYNSKEELNLTDGEIEKGMEFMFESFDKAIKENEKNINNQPWVRRELKTFKYLNELKKW